MALIFDSVALEDLAPETPRVHVPLVVRVPIDVDDVLNDLRFADCESPITSRTWPAGG